MSAPQYDGLSRTTVCGPCGGTFARSMIRAHKRACPKMRTAAPPAPKRGRPPKPDVRACEYARCKVKRFTPTAPNQRYHSEACKRLAADPLSYEERERRHMAPRDAAEAELARRDVETAAELIFRRPAAWNSWVDCLRLPEAMKEAA